MSLTMSLPQIAAVIKETTRTLHEEVEQLLLPQLTTIKNPGDYGSILKMFYGYFQPLENLIHQYITKEELPDIADRRKAAAIRNDLNAIGDSEIAWQSCTHLPRLQNTAQAFGALYVLEGSTLGGKMIAKMLLKNAAFSTCENALTFFSGYGEDTGNKWKTFLDVLNRQENAGDVVHGANETFLYLKRWMQHCFSHE
ncbi:biliverdin-producing heme oxygenase [Flavisolibacter nicotianae]|uniref:biliverdin-producing heme oxygenase n=1 Tax=Flavisolibacter nicotianae TaxID=2364882 RepID=UPI000EB3011E|nr:biliverdin-producing heme oxygenase [Flavisolibacter nicotianae]